MNQMHRTLCSSAGWAALTAERLSHALRGFDLGDRVLEIGPGFGATTNVLLDLAPSLTALEIDHDSSELLRGKYGARVDVVEGSGAEMPFPDDSFSAVVCFTMLHHVPTAALQDAIFAEAARVLRPGGVFRGTDSQLNLKFRALHIGDTMNVLDAERLPERLDAAGFAGVQVEHEPGRIVRFAGVAP